MFLNFFDQPITRFLQTSVLLAVTCTFISFCINLPKHHYVVREIAVISTCNCNGHGNGDICPVNVTTGLRECQCADNTCGRKCDRCCPGFNQYLWKPSNGPAWRSDMSTACESKYSLPADKSHFVSSPSGLRYHNY